MTNMMTTRTKRGALMPALLSLLLLVNLCGVARAQEARPATGTLRGAVTANAPDGQSYNIPAASLKLKGGTQQVAEASANDAGEYEFADVQPGTYTLSASVQGFKTTSKPVTVRAGETSVENFSLEVADVSESVTVTSGDGGVETTEAAPAAQLKQSTLQTVPLVNERFLDALPLVPGVVRGPDGQINVKGGRPSQSGMTVNSSNVTDPVTGDYAINLPIEAIDNQRLVVPRINLQRQAVRRRHLPQLRPRRHELRARRKLRQLLQPSGAAQPALRGAGGLQLHAAGLHRLARDEGRRRLQPRHLQRRERERRREDTARRRHAQPADRFRRQWPPAPRQDGSLLLLRGQVVAQQTPDA
jgi:Carboxypeptidase regulatory-like domain